MYIDTHAHFDMILKESGYSEDDVLNNLKKDSVLKAVQVAVSVESFDWSRSFAVRNKEHGIFFTIGIHPTSPGGEEELEAMENYLKALEDSPDIDVFLGMGECGLDYYHKKTECKAQTRAFEHQIYLANKMHKPLIVHTRDAWPDTLNILRANKSAGGIIHCFSGDARAAREAIDLGFYISFAGNLTYNKAVNLHEAAKFIPLDSLLLETDAPFLSPVPKRGESNAPWNVRYTYEFIAGLKKIDVSEIEEAVSRNFERLIRES